MIENRGDSLSIERSPRARRKWLMPPKGWKKPKEEPRQGAIQIWVKCDHLPGDHDPEPQPVGRRSCVSRRTPLTNRKALVRGLQKKLHEMGGDEMALREVDIKREMDAERLLKLFEYIARCVGKTFAVQGDACELSDDEALSRIRDAMEEVDPDIIERNKNKKLNRRARL